MKVLKVKNYSLSDATQRRLWEKLRDLRQVSEETSLINLQRIENLRKSQRFENNPSLRHLWNAAWGVSEMHLRCIHARWVKPSSILALALYPIVFIKLCLKIKAIISFANFSEFYLRINCMLGRGGLNKEEQLEKIIKY